MRVCDSRHSTCLCVRMCVCSNHYIILHTQNWASSSPSICLSPFLQAFHQFAVHVLKMFAKEQGQQQTQMEGGAKAEGVEATWKAITTSEQRVKPILAKTSDKQTKRTEWNGPGWTGTINKQQQQQARATCDGAWGVKTGQCTMHVCVC